MLLLRTAAAARPHLTCSQRRGQVHATPTAAAAAAPPHTSGRSRGRSQRVAARAWQQVLDAASGRPYYWNTATNETAWELPVGETAVVTAAAASAAPSSSSSEASKAATSSSATSSSSSSSTKSFDEMVALLAEAYSADTSGMAYWEAARALRGDGVFEPAFFDHLERRSRDDDLPAETRELAAKMMARLANPLLRQPAPFEF